MTGAVSFAFVLGVLAPLAPAGLPWTLAALGFSVSSADGRATGLRPSLGRGVATGTLAGVAFASFLLLAAALKELGLDLADGLAIPNLLLSATLLVLGLGLAFQASRFATAPSRAVPLLIALAFAACSMPGVLAILHRLLERSADQSAGGVIGATALVIAGAATAFAAISVAGILIGHALASFGALRRALGAVAVIAGGAISVAYWLPDARGSVDDPGSGLGETLSDVSRSVGDFLAGNVLVPALFFLALAAMVLLGSARTERA